MAIIFFQLELSGEFISGQEKKALQMSVEVLPFGRLTWTTGLAESLFSSGKLNMQNRKSLWATLRMESHIKRLDLKLNISMKTVDDVISFMLEQQKFQIRKQGGVASSFRSVKTNQLDNRSLFQVKGKRRPRLVEVDCEWDSFNEGDVFILDYQNWLIQWNGKEANRFEKLKVGHLEKIRK